MVKITNNRPWKLINGWMNQEETFKWKKILYENIIWEQPIVKVFGKEYLIPRKTVFLGENNLSYSYSGASHFAKGWPSWFYPLLDKVCNESETKLNGCLLNLYKDGNDRMGWHCDNEKELDISSPILSLSFGAARELFFKNRFNSIKEKLLLKDGDLLIMYPKCQIEWLHSLPPRKKVKDSRINLTFRTYLKKLK